MGERIGIIGRLVGRTDSWSGIPEGLASGFKALGKDPFFLSAEPSPRTDEVIRRWLALTSRMDSSWAQTAEAMLVRRVLVAIRRRSSRRARSTDLWVQMGSEFGRPVTSFVTFDDMTVALAVGLPDYPTLRSSVAYSWIRKQKEIYRRAKACCMASRWGADSIIGYGIDPKKVHVVGFGCNLKVDVRNRDWSAPRFLFLGLGWKRKNGEAVVRAFRALREKVPGARLSLVGDHPRMDEVGVDCLGMLRLGHMPERVRLEAVVAKSTCLVVPSTYEPFGIVYAEAGWAGIPSIGTTVGGARDAIGPGGVVIDPYSPDQLLTAMRALSNPKVASDIGADARRHSHLLSWEEVAKRIARCLGVLEDGGDKDLPAESPRDLDSL